MEAMEENGSKNQGWAVTSAPGGGGSGGGSVNIFYNAINEKGTIQTIGGLGGVNSWTSVELKSIGGNGGDGSVACGNISTGTYQEYIESVE